MDAAIMDGATLEAGSVAGVSATKNPIALARAVMEHSPYVMMVGPGADAFASASICRRCRLRTFSPRCAGRSC